MFIFYQIIMYILQLENTSNKRIIYKSNEFCVMFLDLKSFFEALEAYNLLVLTIQIFLLSISNTTK